MSKLQIAISGCPGAGKSSTGRAIAKILGYDFFSAGEFRRMAASDIGIDIDTLNMLENVRTKVSGISKEKLTPEKLSSLGLGSEYHKAFHRLLSFGDTDILVDSKQRQMAKSKEKIVVEGRLAYMHFTDSFKVFFYCNPEVSASRVFADKRVTEKTFGSEKEVLSRILSSMHADRQRYMAKYGDIGDCYTYHPSKFDFYIDTTSLKPDEVTKKVISEYKKWKDSKKL